MRTMGIIAKVFLLIIVVTISLNCNNPDETNTFIKPDTGSFKNNIALKRPAIFKGNAINELANLLAGNKTDSFTNIQNENYYRNYKKTIHSDWITIQNVSINPVKKWIETENIGSASDTATLFYPFSGPDFIYAYTFFPFCKNYILFGLENTGTLPDFNKTSPNSVAQYLNNLQHTFRYMNKHGFFVTEHLKNDFTDTLLNGAIHIILFYMGRLNLQIESLKYIYIDNYGKIKPIEGAMNEIKIIDGIQITFQNAGNSFKQTLYYFPVDVSDENLKEYPEFLFFVNNLGSKITYIKSGSYLLHEPGFSQLKKIICKQTVKLLQDETGLSFTDIAANFKYTLYGSYTKTLPDFEKYHQPMLAQAIKNENAKPLPFKLGYGSQLHETVIIAGTPLLQHVTNNEVTYKVQIIISWEKIPLHAEKFQAFTKVDYYFDSGFYKYTIGSENSEEACMELVKSANQNGFPDAFILAFYKGNRISLEQAKTINQKYN